VVGNEYFKDKYEEHKGDGEDEEYEEEVKPVDRKGKRKSQEANDEMEVDSGPAKPTSARMI
jgi:hypothetical protein